jgi:hypothetical protein
MPIEKADTKIGISHFWVQVADHGYYWRHDRLHTQVRIADTQVVKRQ